MPKQSAVNVLSCENAAIKRQASSHSLHTLAPRMASINIFPDGGYRNHMGVAHSSCYELLAMPNKIQIELYHTSF